VSSYAFQWRSEVAGAPFVHTWDGAREYLSDKTACLAARAMLRKRTSSPRDELHVYRGRVNGWGSIEGRCIGKVMHDPNGTGFVISFYTGKPRDS
jgi:hypothetical protein